MTQDGTPVDVDVESSAPSSGVVAGVIDGRPADLDVLVQIDRRVGVGVHLDHRIVVGSAGHHGGLRVEPQTGARADLDTPSRGRLRPIRGGQGDHRGHRTEVERRRLREMHENLDVVAAQRGRRSPDQVCTRRPGPANGQPAGGTHTRRATGLDDDLDLGAHLPSGRPATHRRVGCEMTTHPGQHIGGGGVVGE